MILAAAQQASESSESSESLVRVALVAFGGAFIGGLFVLLGGAADRRGASTARTLERAAMNAADHAERQRQIADRAMREVITLYKTLVDVGAHFAVIRLNRALQASDQEMLELEGQHTVAFRRHADAWLDAVGTVTLIDDPALRTEARAVVDCSGEQVSEFITKPVMPGTERPAANLTPEELLRGPEIDQASVGRMRALIEALAGAARKPHVPDA